MGKLDSAIAKAEPASVSRMDKSETQDTKVEGNHD